jgi:predicted Zn-dependent protease
VTHDRMIRYFEMQQDRRPRSRFFIPLADLYRATGRLEAAASLLEEGLGRCGDSVSARLVLARVRRDQGRMPEARDLAREVLERDPGHREAPCLLDLPDREPDREGETPAAGTTSSGSTAAEPVAVPESAPWRETVVEDPAEFAAPDPESAASDPAKSGPVTPDPVAPVPAAVPDVGPAPRFLTQTLAEIYLAQGHRQKALAILRRLLAEHPERSDVAHEIAVLEAVDATVESTSAAPGTAAAGASAAGAARGAAPDLGSAAGGAAADPNRARFEAWVDRQQGGPS